MRGFLRFNITRGARKCQYILNQRERKVKLKDVNREKLYPERRVKLLNVSKESPPREPLVRLLNVRRGKQQSDESTSKVRD